MKPKPDSDPEVKVMKTAFASNKMMEAEWDEFKDSIQGINLIHRTLRTFGRNPADATKAHEITVYVLCETYKAWRSGIEHLRDKVMDAMP